MKSVTKLVRDEFLQNEHLQFGLEHGLFNLTQLARFLRPLLEARGRKSLSESAVVMALSRLKGTLKRPRSRTFKPGFKFESIQVASNLSILAYQLPPEERKAIFTVLRNLNQTGRPFTFTQGMNQLSLFVSRDDLDTIARKMGRAPIKLHRTVAVISAVVSDAVGSTPGFFSVVFQQLYVQGINVLEIASTTTELLIYVDEKDLRLAFDTLYAQFVSNRAYS